MTYKSGMREVTTRRRADVWELIADGKSNAEIATQLRIAPETVKGLVGSLYRDLGVHNRAAAAAAYVKARPALEAPPALPQPRPHEPSTVTVPAGARELVMKWDLRVQAPPVELWRDDLPLMVLSLREARQLAMNMLTVAAEIDAEVRRRQEHQVARIPWQPPAPGRMPGTLESA